MMVWLPVGEGFCHTGPDQTQLAYCRQTHSTPDPVHNQFALAENVSQISLIELIEPTGSSLEGHGHDHQLVVFQHVFLCKIPHVVISDSINVYTLFISLLAGIMQIIDIYNL